MPDLKDDAIYLAMLGFKVFPIKASYNSNTEKWEKRPFTSNGFKDGSNDPARVNELFNTHHDAWIGLVHDDMTVVDADGETGVDTLNKALPALPEASLITRTVSGGIHYYIPGTTELEGRKVRLLPGLDILTGNNKGCVVVPPSPGYKILTGSFTALAEDIQSELGRQTPDSTGTRPDGISN